MCAGADNPGRGRRGDAGFTLLETLIALIIFVACYVLIHEGLSLGWKGVRLAQSELAALKVAQSRIAAAGVDQPLAEGQQAGESDGYAWTMEVRRRADTQASGTSPLAAFWVTVVVQWRDRTVRGARSVELTTLKLVAGP